MKPPIYFYIEIDKVIITLIIPSVNYFDLEITFPSKKSPTQDRRFGSIIFVVGKSPIDIMEPILL